MPPIANVANRPDTRTLSSTIEQIKMKFPQHDDATVLAENDTPYDKLGQVMDAVRSGHQMQGRKLVTTDFFPNISVGDAPVRKP